MIFAIGFAMLLVAAFLSWSLRPSAILGVVVLAGLSMMLTSVCMLIARYMP